jgi:peptidoglycan/LPS O-acetylase OafA/YrhL
LVFLLKIKKKGITPAMILILIAVSLTSSIVQWNAGVPYLRIYLGSDTRAYGILIGCLSAVILSSNNIPRTENIKKVFHAASVLSLAGIILSFFVLRHYAAFVYNGGFALIAIGTSVIVLDFVIFPSKLSRVFEFDPLVWLGKISYGLYLWHFPILEASKKVFDGRLDPVIYGSLGVIATLIVAGTSYYLIEQPFIRLKDRHCGYSDAKCGERMAEAILHFAESRVGEK